MKKLGLLLLLIPLFALATIYEYKAKDGVSYYTEGVPTGLTTTEKAQYVKRTQAQVDALNKDKPISLHGRNAVKAIQKKDNAVVVLPTCDADKVWSVVENKCVSRCTAPEVWNATANKCEVLALPDPPSANGPPSVRVACPEEQPMHCNIPAGTTATIWYGAGGVSGKWAVKQNVTGYQLCNNSNIGDPKSGTYNRCYYVDSRLLAKDLDPKGQNLMPQVNLALVPKGSDGFSTPMIKAAAIPKSESFPYAGAFRIGCEYSHMNNDDPIVYPGVPNATHHHTFFGNTGANAYSTNDSLRNSGNSTCAGGILNRSGYWMPSLINTSNGAPAKPTYIVVYYKAADEKSGMHIKTPPAGLRMIAGNAKPLAIADAQGGFFCQDQTQVLNPANWGIMWQGNHIKQSCGGPNQMLRMIISFPQCWDGKNLDSPDHKSHMEFICGDECKNAQGVIAKSANSCPASHPIQLPSITINADFFGLDPTAKYRLASDNYSTAYPGGYSLHADWMNGWHEQTIESVVNNCLVNPKNCGGPNLGNGQTLYGVNQD